MENTENKIEDEVAEEVTQSTNDSENGFELKTFIPILIGLILMLILFFKFVLPALEEDVDHSASPLLEPTTEFTYESFFGK